MNDERLSQLLLGYLDALMVLYAARGEAPEDWRKRIDRGAPALVALIIGQWQLLSDDAQQRFLADNPEHAEPLNDFLIQFASATGGDMAELTAKARDLLARMDAEEE